VTATPADQPTQDSNVTPTVEVEEISTSETETMTATGRAGEGEIVVRPADGMEMVFVPGGEFQMGSTDEQVDQAWQMCKDYDPYCIREWIETEQPAHTVTLDGFWLDRTEVTNEQFARFVEDAGHQTDAEKKDSGYAWTGSGWGQVDGAHWQYPGGPDTDVSGQERHPVVQISWNDAQAYCQWAGARLPTEAEWEYAARGPEDRVYPWGDTFDCKPGSFDDETEIDSYVVSGGEGCDGFARTAPAGSFPNGASWVGVLDMAGNVWEWVADWYEDYPSEKQVNPTGPALGDMKVLRGGSWDDTSDNVRGACRRWNFVDRSGSRIGFRCARNS
jgi:serine/threonine-protein kinase